MDDDVVESDDVDVELVLDVAVLGVVEDDVAVLADVLLLVVVKSHALHVTGHALLMGR